MVRNLHILSGCLIGIISGIALLWPYYELDWNQLTCLEFRKLESASYVAMGVPFLLSFIVIRIRVYHKRRKKLNFGGALLSGVFITIIACLSFYLVNGLFYTVFRPRFLENFQQVYGRCLIERADNEVMEELAAMAIQKMTPYFENGWNYSLLLTTDYFMVGISVTILLALLQGLFFLTRY